MDLHYGQAPAHDDLPRYTRRRTLAHTPSPAGETRSKTSHSFASASSSCLKLVLNSSAKSSTRIPTYFEDDAIEGIVYVTAEKGDSIQGLALSVVGKVSTGLNHEPFTFLETGSSLWRRPEGSNAEKMRGSCEFPFSFALPRKVSVGGQEPTRLPQTFSERDSRVNVSYELTVTLERGRLRSDVALKTPFAYVPLSKPPAFSILRQLAYNSPTVTALPNPSVDPDGWLSLPPILFAASPMSSSRRFPAAQLVCQLSLAAPMSYTRGSVLPLAMSFSPAAPVPSDDTIAALDVVSTPSTPSSALMLRRHIRYANKRGSWKDEVIDIQAPIFWRPRGERNKRYVDANGAEQRILEGEIELPKELMPSVDIGVFSVTYELVMKELIVPGMLCTHVGRPSNEGSTSVWASKTVEIVGGFGKGPKPVAYAPQSYGRSCVAETRAHASSQPGLNLAMYGPVG